MVGGVVGVGHDEHVVLLGLGAHGVVADDHLPVSAPVVPADHDRLALGQPALDGVHPDLGGGGLVVQVGGIGKSAHAVKDIHGLPQGGAGVAGQPGALQGVAQGGQALLVPVAQPVIPVEHHQGAGDAAGPFAGLLHGLEAGQDREGVAGLHVVVVGVGKVGGVRVVAQPLHGVGAVLGGEIHGMGDLHLVGKGGALRRARCGIRRGCLGRPSRLAPARRVGTAGQKAGRQGEAQRQSDLLFHFSISFNVRFCALRSE